MKNKFMTKALAVVLSASMALSLSSATALTANAAAAPKLNKKTVTVKAGKKAKVKLKAASYKAGWRITKATVKKAAKAKAKVKKNKKVVVVTGVSKGATKVVLKLKNAKTGASKKLKFKTKVTVDEVIVEPTVETTTVTAAKQTTFDTVDLTFDKAVDATQVSVETVAINGSVGAATTVAVSGNQATVSYGYAENTEYAFTVANFNGAPTVKTGSYAVKDIKIADQTVEAGSDQPIVYSLVAENDVDVTKYNNYTDYVDFQFEGDYTSYSSDAIKPTINFDEKDKTATVTVKFDNGTGEAITKTVKITSTAATATKGAARYAAGNLKKWYLVDSTSESFNIHPDDTDSTKVYFYAKGEDGKAIKFSEIEVLSSNENVATATYDAGDSGKFFIINVAPGGDQGNATITLKTTESKGSIDVPSEYKFSVASKEKNNNFYAVNVASTSAALYNGQYGHATDIEMKPVNSLNEVVEVVDSIEVKKGNDNADDVITATWNSSNNKLHIDALGAPAGNYKVNVTFTGESGSNSKDITKQISVRVTDVLSAVYAATNDEDKPEYVWNVDSAKTTIYSDKKAAVKAELSANFKVEVENLNITDTSGSKTSFEPKLAVYVNSKPIGYLSATGVKGFAEGEVIGQKAVKKALSKLTVAESEVDLAAISVFVYSGANYYDDYDLVDTLYLGQANKTEFVVQDKSESSNTIALGGKVSLYESGNQTAIEYYGAGNVKNSCAKDGNYNVVVKYMDKTFVDKDGKATGNKFANGYQLGTSKFTVSYTLTMPKVEYNASASADKPVIADVDLVRAEDGASVTWVSGTTKRDNKVQYKYNSLDRKTAGVSKEFKSNQFGTQGLSKGDKIFAVCVEDMRGAWNDNDAAVAGGSGSVMIHFIFEDTKTVKA